MSKFVEILEEKLNKNNLGEKFSFKDYKSELNALTPTRGFSKFGAYNLIDEEFFLP